MNARIPDQSITRIIVAFLVGTLAGALSMVQVFPRGEVASGLPQAGPQGPAPVQGTASNSPVVQGSAAPIVPRGGLDAAGVTAANDSCRAGHNGGATDQGVSATSIKFATTVVDSGIGAAFLRDVRFAMEAVKNRVNRQGGICGRRLDIRYVDDGWDAQRGAQYLRNFFSQPDPSKRVFGIPIGPSSEGLRVVIASGDLDKYQIPVVGADGLLQDQYVCGDSQPGCSAGRAQRWVWPVAAATVSSARIMVADAFARQGLTKASDYSIVYDKNYRFGVEGATAFNAEVKRRTGQSIKGSDSGGCRDNWCPIQAGQSSYTEVGIFKPAKMVALFLEPQTALAWMSAPSTKAANEVIYYGAQPLFTYDFGNQCKNKCDQMWVWTGFKPNLELYRNDPAVRTYVQELATVNPQADPYNQFAEGAYVGMQLLVEALEQVGGNLTRARLKSALDALQFSPGLSIQGRVAFSPVSRYANFTMQGFQMQYKGTFGGWRMGAVVKDPLLNSAG